MNKIPSILDGLIDQDEFDCLNSGQVAWVIAKFRKGWTVGKALTAIHRAN